ncbi:MAG: hypothetical protein ACRDY6_21360 [Acidimicrobiia bacterium]
MKRSAVVVLIVVVAALGACDDSDSSSGARQRSADTSSTTTTAPPPVLELATPDGYRHSFRVVGTRVGLGGLQAAADIELANVLDLPDRRLNRPQGETRRLMLGVRQERFGGACPSAREERYDYDIYVAAPGYCVITSSSLSGSYDLPREPSATSVVTLTADLSNTIGVEAADIGVFFFDPLLSLTPVREVLSEGATYDVDQRPECINPESGELRPECEAAFHPDLLVPVPQSAGGESEGAEPTTSPTEPTTPATVAG